MGGFWIVLIIIVTVIVGAVLWVISAYNKMVAAHNLVEQSWNQIDVELNRRYDLIPNLVNTIKGATAHEQGTLEAVIALRNQAASMAGAHADPASRAKVEEQLSGQLRNLLSVSVEAYPDLKANANFMQLQNELSEIESRIANARKYYKATVGDYNTMIQSFPTSFLAGQRFTRAEYFQIPDQAIRQNPVVDFSSSAPMAPPTAGYSPNQALPGQMGAPMAAPQAPFAQPGVASAPFAQPAQTPGYTPAPDQTLGAQYAQPDFSQNSGIPDSK
ncbi:MAG: LemA family protein [Propionibacteriaceae bacterium]|jgi:LemA protein|nr:LemA family protein [Propionibacteriaceae bacterium]